MIAYFVTILTLVSIVAILGLALNLQWGLCGMVNFGMAGFFALGAYLPPWWRSPAPAAWPPRWRPLWSCAAACGFIALISLRLSEEYLAILTLGFGEVIRLVVLNEEWLTHGRARPARHSAPVLGLGAGEELRGMVPRPPGRRRARPVRRTGDSVALALRPRHSRRARGRHRRDHARQERG